VQGWRFFALSLVLVAVSAALIATVLLSPPLSLRDRKLEDFRRAIVGGRLNVTAVSPVPLAPVAGAVGLRMLLLANATVSAPAGSDGNKIVATGSMRMLGASASVEMTFTVSHEHSEQSVELRANMPDSWGVNAMPAIAGNSDLPPVKVKDGVVRLQAGNGTLDTSVSGVADPSLATMHAALGTLQLVSSNATASSGNSTAAANGTADGGGVFQGLGRASTRSGGYRAQAAATGSSSWPTGFQLGSFSGRMQGSQLRLSFLPPGSSASLLGGLLVIDALELILDANATTARLGGSFRASLPGGKAIQFE
jgi:hypothetical protein